MMELRAHQAAAGVCVLFLFGSTAFWIRSVMFESIWVGSGCAQVPLGSGLSLLKMNLCTSGSGMFSTGPFRVVKTSSAEIFICEPDFYLPKK